MYPNATIAPAEQASAEPSNESRTPGIAVCLSVVGYVAVILSLLIGFLAVLTSMSSADGAPFVVFAEISAGVLSGLILIGFAAVIEKLSLIEGHLRKNT